MSMHLCGPGLTTTSYKKRKVKITKARQTELESNWRDRNQRLKQMGLPKETFEQFMEWVYGKGKKTKTQAINNPACKTTSSSVSPKIQQVSSNTGCKNNNEGKDVGKHPSSGVTSSIQVSSLQDWITGPVSSKPPPTYTGHKVVGIAQMAKSNAVPVFNQDEIIDIARMRR